MPTSDQDASRSPRRAGRWRTFVDRGGVIGLAQGRFFVAFVIVFAAWTLLSSVAGLRLIDDVTLAPWIPSRSNPGQVAEAFAVVTHPAVVFVVILGLSLWSLRRRMRRLAGALALMAIALPVTTAIQVITEQPRPASPYEDSLAYQVAGYPSPHMVAVTVLAWVMATLSQARRSPSSSVHRSRLLAAVLVLAVFADQWFMRTHTLSQLIGGVLFGLTWASGVLALTGVDRILQGWAALGLPTEASDKRAAIVYNPTKVLDFALFRRRVESELQRAGWKPPLWLETERDDPGARMARDAVAAGVDVVMVAGGDGTVRVVCQELAGTGVPVALIPAGTGNLLARNLGVSLDENEAIRTALAGSPTAIDLIRCTTDAGEATCAVMGGLGFDAKIMGNTNADLKKTIKAGAYVVAAAQQLALEPFTYTMSIDGTAVEPRSAIMTLVGNVGRLMGGVNLIPGARPDDGALDVMIAAPSGLRQLVQVAGGIAWGAQVDPLTYEQARTVEIVADQPVACQLDGDYEGESTFFRSEVLPGVLQVMLEEDAPRPWAR